MIEYNIPLEQCTSSWIPKPSLVSDGNGESTVQAPFEKGFRIGKMGVYTIVQLILIPSGTLSSCRPSSQLLSAAIHVSNL